MRHSSSPKAFLLSAVHLPVCKVVLTLPVPRADTATLNSQRKEGPLLYICFLLLLLLLN